MDQFHPTFCVKCVTSYSTTKLITIAVAVGLLVCIALLLMMLPDASSTTEESTSIRGVFSSSTWAYGESTTDTDEIKPYFSEPDAALAASADNQADILATNPVSADTTTEISEILLDVPLIGQNPELPTGCEATAVAMLFNYAGVSVSKTTIARQMPYSVNDPNQGYVGDPFTFDGWTIYPPALIELMRNGVGSAIDLTGASSEVLRNTLAQGHPVVCWVALHGFTVHCIVLVGYNSESFFYNDPYTEEKDAELDNADFERVWGALGYRALSY